MGGACARREMSLFIDGTRGGADMVEEESGSGESGVTEWDSDESEVIQSVVVRRVDVPGYFLKRTYGVDLTADSSLERRCKSAKLDEQLDGLRAVLPDSASRGRERASVVTDAYHYIATLQRQVEDLNAELLEDSVSANAPVAQTRDEQYICEGQWSLSRHSELRQQPIQVDVAKRNGLLEVRIVCVNRCGLLVDVMEAVEARGFTILQARIACHNEIVVEYLSLESEDSRSVLTEGEKAESVDSEVERVKAMLVHAICKEGFGSDTDFQ